MSTTQTTQVSEKVRQVREERGMGQSELARRSGVSRQSIVNVENGAVEPYLGTLRKLAQALDVSVTEFLDE